MEFGTPVRLSGIPLPHVLLRSPPKNPVTVSHPPGRSPSAEFFRFRTYCCLLTYTPFETDLNGPSVEGETRGGEGVWGLACEFENKTCSDLTSVEFVGNKAQVKPEDGVQFGLCHRCVGQPRTGY